MQSKTKITLLGFSLWAFACGGGSDDERSTRIDFPYRPPAGSAYLFAGQSEKHLGGLPDSQHSDGYLDRVDALPSGFSLYGGFSEIESLDDFEDLRWVGVANRYLALPALENSIFHLSINWVHEEQALAGEAEAIAAEEDVLNGRYDLFLDALADWCSAETRPILLRLGYEFNRPIQALFTPERFVPVYRHIVDRLRARGVDGVAFVWASANLTFSASTPSPQWDFELWYPGDDYVDWFGYSMWFPNVEDSVMMAEARARNKPVLLAESTPLEFDVGESLYYPLLSEDSEALTADALWEAWWSPMLQFIEENIDVIGGWHYIANDWADDEMWGANPLFRNSDARPWADEEILENWTQAVSGPLFVQPQPGRY